MHKLKSMPVKLAAIAYLVVSGAATSAAESACPNFYAGGQAPQPINVKLTVKLRELCSDGFVVEHSGVTRTPLWSAELITREHVITQKGMTRENAFHPDERLPASERSELQDYVRSGYDRGHLTPSASAWTPQLQYQTFAMSNMIPQDPNNNRELHAHIEMAVRKLAKSAGSLYVITGPVYSGSQMQWLNRRVAVPTQVFKLVYEPRSGKAAAYLENNTDSETYKVISIAELDALTGIHFLPGVNVTGMLNLPPPDVPQKGFLKTAGLRARLKSFF